MTPDDHGPDTTTIHTVQCQTCKEHHSAYTALNPDPQRRADHINAGKVASWLRSHPCMATTAHPKRLARGAAA